MQSENTESQVKLTHRRKWTKDLFLDAYVKGALGTKTNEGNYIVRSDGRLEYTAHGEDGGTETVAVRLPSGMVFSNANTLKFCGSRMAWGRRTQPWGQVAAQVKLEESGAMPLPFSIFETARLSVSQARVIEKAPSEEVLIGKDTDERWDRALGKTVHGKRRRHYVGACLLEVSGNFFLFDIDRQELLHGIFNPFVVKLSREAMTIEEAYAMLVPEKVEQAKADGVRVFRQGEWFFIKRFEELPTDRPKPTDEMIEKATRAPHAIKFGGHVSGTYKAGDDTYRGCEFEDAAMKEAYEKAVEEWTKANLEVSALSPQKGELKTGISRPNTVDKFVVYNGMTLASGMVKHSGREHQDLNLGSAWYEAVPNTAVGAWQVSGDID